MNKLAGNENNHFVYVTCISNGEVFFANRMVGIILQSRDLANLRRVCKALSNVKELEKKLITRYKIEFEMPFLEERMNLFLEIAKRSNHFNVFIKKYKDCECGFSLNKILRCENYIYALDLVNSLTFLFQENFVINKMVINVLNEILSIGDNTIKKCFLENILGYSDLALCNKLEGFVLLEEFTNNYITTLGRTERLYLRTEIITICQEAIRYETHNFLLGKNIFLVYGAKLGMTQEFEDYLPQRQSHRRNCIIS